MSGVALYSLDVAAGQLQLVGDAGVTEAMEHDRRQIVFLNQILHCSANDRGFRGHSQWRGDHQIEFHVLIANGLNDCVLLHLPGYQHFSNGLGQKNLAVACFRFRLFQHQDC